MKIQPCKATVPSPARMESPRQCLLAAGHEQPHPDDGLHGRRQLGSKPHEFAPLCPLCNCVQLASPGDSTNVHDGAIPPKPLILSRDAGEVLLRLAFAATKNHTETERAALDSLKSLLNERAG